ncbi:MAG TPA: hypothetical protein VHN81_11385, partial [Edaphobacter sp.]|nr:hypothetical protein [Edaphobacter sp.]
MWSTLYCVFIIGALSFLTLREHNHVLAATSSQTLLPISIDYPEQGSIFPPGITPPTFIWRDAAGTSWSIDIAFADHSQPIHLSTRGERMHIGTIDPKTVSENNELPKLTSQQAASWTWTPDPATWSKIQLHSVSGPATFTISGYRNGTAAWSQSHIEFATSRDEVGGSIFYRDVPLMPSAGV